MIDLTTLYRNKYHYKCIQVSPEAAYAYKLIKREYRISPMDLSEKLIINAMNVTPASDLHNLPAKIQDLSKRRLSVRVSGAVFEFITHTSANYGISKGVLMTHIIYSARFLPLTPATLAEINSLEFQLRRRYNESI